jgi:hypothetical protein
MVSGSTANNPTSGDSQGGVDIAGVTGLMYPQNGFKPVSNYNHRTDISRTGTPYSIDGLTSSDSWETTFDLQCNDYKASELIRALSDSATGRAGDVSMFFPNYSYPFGMDQGSGGNYSGKLLGSERTKNEVIIKTRHDRYGQWTIPLSFWMGSKVGVSLQDVDGAATSLQDTDGALVIYQDKE